MGQTVKVKPNQSFLDVIANTCGSLEAGMLVALDNGWPITHMPPVDRAVFIGDHTNKDITSLKYIIENSVVIGTKGTPPANSVLVTEDTEETIIAEDGSDIFAQEE